MRWILSGSRHILAWDPLFRAFRALPCQPARPGERPFDSEAVYMYAHPLRVRSHLHLLSAGRGAQREPLPQVQGSAHHHMQGPVLCSPRYEAGGGYGARSDDMALTC